MICQRTVNNKGGELRVSGKVLFDGTVDVHYGFIDVHDAENLVDWERQQEHRGQVNGLCGAACAGVLRITASWTSSRFWQRNCGARSCPVIAGPSDNPAEVPRCGRIGKPCRKTTAVVG